VKRITPRYIEYEDGRGKCVLNANDIIVILILFVDVLCDSLRNSRQRHAYKRFAGVARD